MREGGREGRGRLKNPAGAAESSCWQRGRGEVESVSALEAWHRLPRRK